MSNILDKIEVVTSKNRKSMISTILSNIKKFPEQIVLENLVEFSERKRKLVAGSSARPGLYSFGVTPFWREPSFQLSESNKTVEVAIKKCTQSGGTEILLNHTLYCVEYGIGPICYVSSDEQLSLKHSETRVAPMIDAAGMNGYIQSPVKSKSNKSTGSAKGLKFFRGTFMQFIGARSESKASSTPIRILMLDEVDKYPLQMSSTQGGSPVVKLLRRTDSYGNLKKILYVSTPKRAAHSIIDPAYKEGDMRQYNIECPDCKKLHVLEFSSLKWDKDDEGKLLLEYDDDGNMINDPTWHECPHCKYKMRYHERHDAMQEEGYGGHAKWIPTKKPDRPNIKSYHISGLYSFRSWVDIVLEFQKAKDDPILLEDFITDCLGETWSEKIDKPDQHYLMSRAETEWERGQIPDDVKALSIGADVHPDRIEWQMVGFGYGKQSWSCNYDSFFGDIYEPNDPAWDKMEDILNDEYFKIDGTRIPIHIALFDAQGKAAETVKNFCSRFPYINNSINGVYPCMGKSNVAGIVKDHPSTIATPEILLDDQRLKKEIYQNLKKKKPAVGERYPNGYIHYHSGYNEDFFKQLTAEDIEEISNSKGTHTEIFITNKAQRRNEALDTFKMALAGLYYMYFQYFKIWNKQRKARKKPEIPPSWDLFWSQFDSED